MLDKASGLLPWVERLYQRLRYPTRVEIDLDWKWLGNDSFDVDRMLTVKVIAGKAGEFIVAEAEMEARPGPSEPWTEVPFLNFDSLLSLPDQIPPNRASVHQLRGRQIAGGIEEALGGNLNSFQLRLRVSDHHGTEIKSNILEPTLEELRAEKTM